ncbi:MAG: hypothetical protein KBG17_07425 [Paludibacteraceae bacterium]|nr:hypothetical protein [Paludibacteraceae bacterium]
MNHKSILESQFSSKGNDVWAVFRKDIYNKEAVSKLRLNDWQIKAMMYVKEKGRITNSEYQKLNEI